MRLFLCIVLFAVMPLGGDDEIRLIADLLGVVEVETLSEEEVENLSAYFVSPLDINSLSRSALLSSGLLSAYQVESLLDYRRENGAVASFAELGFVDGFGEDFVRRLAPFVCLGAGVQEKTGWKPVRNELALRSGTVLKGRVLSGTGGAGQDGQGKMSVAIPVGLKYRVTAGERLGLSLGASLPDAGAPQPKYTGSLSVNFKKMPGRMVLGDFNARFGQGLVLWNGAMMTGLNGIASFDRRPSGISSSWSFTGGSALTGLAAEMNFGRFSLSALLAAPGLKQMTEKLMEKRTAAVPKLLPAVNLRYYGRNEQFGLTHYMTFGDYTVPGKFRIPDMKTSLDFRGCYGGVDIFSEMAFDYVTLSAAALAGCAFPAGDALRMALHVRYYGRNYTDSYGGAPRSSGKCSNECGLSLGGDFMAGKRVKQRDAMAVNMHSGSFTVDVACFPSGKASDVYVQGFRHCMQAKVIFNYLLQCSPEWRLTFRLTERLRTWQTEPVRTDLRCDVSYTRGGLFSTLRLNALQCSKIGFLTYLEAGWRNEKIMICARQTYFRTENWSDRIYAYERDAPGSFLVPAYYGHGLSTAAFLSWKPGRRLRFYLRAGWTGYLSPTHDKDGKLDVRVNVVVKL